MFDHGWMVEFGKTRRIECDKDACKGSCTMSSCEDKVVYSKSASEFGDDGVDACKELREREHRERFNFIYLCLRD